MRPLRDLSPKVARLLAAAAFIGLLCGCVERRLLIKSDPEGALVRLDNEPKGLTPVEIPFSYYGARDLVLEKDGFVPLHTIIEVEEPLWQLFPGDFVTDVLVPATIEDVHEFSFALTKEPEGDLTSEDAAIVIERARAMRDRARETEGEPDEAGPTDG